MEAVNPPQLVIGPCWQQVVCNFVDDRECLGGFLAWQAAEVLQGVKPANLINVLDRQLPCGRNMAALWGSHADEVLLRGGLHSRVLRSHNQRQLVLIYRAAPLRRILADHAVAPVLASLGYPTGGSLGAQLRHLQQRMRTESFPHEIGFFLGYPVKDVLGYMGLSDLPLAAKGPWKIYGEAAPSLALVSTHSQARRRIEALLAETASPLALLQKKRPAVLRAA